jgi:hypothetical protein
MVLFFWNPSVHFAAGLSAARDQLMHSKQATTDQAILNRWKGRDAD